MAKARFVKRSNRLTFCGCVTRRIPAHSTSNGIANDSDYYKISNDKHYEYVSAQARYHIDKMTLLFNFAVKGFSAVIGGSVWLSVSHNIVPNRAKEYAMLSNVLMWSILIVSIIMILDNFRSWYGYRKAQSKVAGKSVTGEPIVPGPRVFPAIITEIGMIIIMLVICLCFTTFNPFGTSP